MPEPETSEDVKRKIQDLVNEIVQAHGPVAYLNGCPVYVSDNAQKGQVLFVGTFLGSRHKFMGKNVMNSTLKDP